MGLPPISRFPGVPPRTRSRARAEELSRRVSQSTGNPASDSQDTPPNDKPPSSLKVPDPFSRLPVEIIQHIGKSIHVPRWPPSHSVFFDWGCPPSLESLENLLSLARVCRRVYQIMTPLLMYEVDRDVDKDYQIVAPVERYKWLASHPVWPSFRSIRILHLRDLDYYTESPVSMPSLLDALSPLAETLEVLVLSGFCASVFLETIPLRPAFKLGQLVTLKLYVYTLSAEAVYWVYKACPNLTSLALITETFKPSSEEQMVPVPVAITDLDLSTERYSESAYAALELILRPLIPTLRLVNIHGDFPDALTPVLASLTRSPLTHLGLSFGGDFPMSLMSLQFRGLQKLRICAYEGLMLDFWSAPLLRTVTHLSLRVDELPGPPGPSSGMLALKTVKFQLVAVPADPHEQREFEELREWCKRKGVQFIHDVHPDDTIEYPDAYYDLLSWKLNT